MADSTLPDLDAVITPASTDIFGVRQSGDTRDKKQTRAQLHSLEAGEKLLLDPGTVALPGLAFSGDIDTGIFLIQADQFALVAGGKNCISVREVSSAPRIGFYDRSPIAKQTGVPVTTSAVHAALVSLGLISA